MQIRFSASYSQRHVAKFCSGDAKELEFYARKLNSICPVRKRFFFAGFSATRREKLNLRACVLVVKMIVTPSFLFIRHKQNAKVCLNRASRVPCLVLTT